MFRMHYEAETANGSLGLNMFPMFDWSGKPGFIKYDHSNLMDLVEEVYNVGNNGVTWLVIKLFLKSFFIFEDDLILLIVFFKIHTHSLLVSLLV